MKLGSLRRSELTPWTEQVISMQVWYMALDFVIGYIGSFLSLFLIKDPLLQPSRWQRGPLKAQQQFMGPLCVFYRISGVRIGRRRRTSACEVSRIGGVISPHRETVDSAEQEF